MHVKVPNETSEAVRIGLGSYACTVHIYRLHTRSECRGDLLTGTSLHHEAEYFAFARRQCLNAYIQALTLRTGSEGATT